MIGSDILVAPVFDDKGYVEYYLPEGKWTDVYSGEVITLEHGRYFKESRDYLHMPIFTKG
jgi:alpha-D-xyloside xylohydrolase